MNQIFKFYNAKYDTKEIIADTHKFFSLGAPVAIYNSSLSVAYAVQNLFNKTV